MNDTNHPPSNLQTSNPGPRTSFSLDHFSSDRYVLLKHSNNLHDKGRKPVIRVLKDSQWQNIKQIPRTVLSDCLSKELISQVIPRAQIIKKYGPRKVNPSSRLSGIRQHSALEEKITDDYLEENSKSSVMIKDDPWFGIAGPFNDILYNYYQGIFNSLLNNTALTLSPSFKSKFAVIMSHLESYLSAQSESDSSGDDFNVDVLTNNSILLPGEKQMFLKDCCTLRSSDSSLRDDLFRKAPSVEVTNFLKEFHAMYTSKPLQNHTQFDVVHMIQVALKNNQKSKPNTRGSTSKYMDSH